MSSHGTHEQQNHQHHQHDQHDQHDHTNHQVHASPSNENQDHHRGLDLDAEVFSNHLAAVLNLTPPVARSVIDLGAGTGAGSRLLRERYPEAAITCVDNDPQMLELLRQQGFAVVEADLNKGFPVVPEAPVDLIWASSSLHHVADPARLLACAHDALTPAGSLVVVELASLPSFLSEPGDVLLEQRCHAAATAQGWNHYSDWTPTIEAAGFTVHRSEITTTAPVTPAARDYAQQWFGRFAHLTNLTADDRQAVQDLTTKLPNDHALDLAPRTTRTVWVATPDHTQTQNQTQNQNQE